ncbi:tautomerase family protein [Nocardioides soli]
MISAITVATCDSISAPSDSVRVIIREVPLTHFAAGDVTLAERA